jgi:sec-independent protein translocase protein TatC
MEEASLVDHLTELRVRLVKSIAAIASCFILLIYFSNDIYQFLAEPLQKFLP